MKAPTFSLIVIAALAAVLELAGAAAAQATCEGVTGNGRCNSSNTLSMTMPTTNTDGTAFNDYASTQVVFGSAAGVCATTVGTTVRSLGALGVPVTPLPNTIAKSLLGPIGLPNGKIFLAARVVDLVGNMSACSGEITFVNDNLSPNAPSISVGP